MTTSSSNKFVSETTAWKVSKYGVIYGPYFPVFGLNTGKCGPEITPYLDTFRAVKQDFEEVFLQKFFGLYLSIDH